MPILKATPEQLALIKANTPNFSPDEFMCHCCGKVDMDVELLTRVQALRNYMKTKLIINSGYRCVKHNAAVGGKATSKHLLGQAVDISLRFVRLNGGGVKVDNKLHSMIQMCTHLFNGIGIAKDFIHCDVREFKALWHY